MTKNATLTYDSKSFELPTVVGTEAEIAVDISQLRAKSGLITLDSGYANTGACTSNITFIDGEASSVIAATLSRSWPKSRVSSKRPTS